MLSPKWGICNRALLQRLRNHYGCQEKGCQSHRQWITSKKQRCFPGHSRIAVQMNAQCLWQCCRKPEQFQPVKIPAETEGQYKASPLSKELLSEIAPGKIESQFSLRMWTQWADHMPKQGCKSKCIWAEVAILDRFIKEKRRKQIWVSSLEIYKILNSRNKEYFILQCS